MGKAITTCKCRRIDISQLLKDGYLKDGLVVTGSYTWTESGYGKKFTVTIIADFSGKEKYIRLLYETNKKELMDSMISIEGIHSNLGRGEVWYFLCPETRQRCRIIYKTDSSTIFKSKQAYKERIYYPMQLLSKSEKFERDNTKYWKLMDQVSELKKKRFAGFYNGQLTARYIATEKKKLLLEQAELVTVNHIKLSDAALAIAKEFDFKLGLLESIPGGNELFY